MSEPYGLTFMQPEIDVPSENWMKGAHWAAASSRMSLWRDAAFYAWKGSRTSKVGAVTGIPCIVTLDIGFHVRRRRDPHNYVGTVCKSVIDGLVLSGCWEDDNPEWVTVTEPMLTVHNRTPREQALPCNVYFTPRENA